MSIEFKMTFKELKRSLKIYEGYYRTGRIKRMRTRRESRYVRLDKRIGKKAYSFNSDFCSNLTRWNRH